jgi:hypothetical protein
MYIYIAMLKYKYIVYYIYWYQQTLLISISPIKSVKGLLMMRENEDTYEQLYT